MLKVARLPLLAGLVLACIPAAPAQEPGVFGGTQSVGFSSSFSNTSSHILIGESEGRRVWTLGAEYTRLLHLSPHYRLDYAGTILPLYEETDPTVIGTTLAFNGQQIVIPQTPVRVIYVPRGPVGSTLVTAGVTVPVYAVLSRQDTYAALLSPLGARISALPRSRIQPTFAVDLGLVVSARDIPVANSDQFNFMFAFGPGLQIFRDARTSWRFEYLYRHTSNAGEGQQNPGVDQGVLRVTVNLHH